MVPGHHFIESADTVCIKVEVHAAYLLGILPSFHGKVIVPAIQLGAAAPRIFDHRTESAIAAASTASRKLVGLS
jgi:hypothetical protein